MPCRQVSLLLLVIWVALPGHSAVQAEEKLRIIAFGAHPDDCELRAAGVSIRAIQPRKLSRAAIETLAGSLSEKRARRRLASRALRGARASLVARGRGAI